MSLDIINFTLPVFCLIIVILLLFTLHAHGLTRECAWYLTTNPLFSEL